MTALLTIEDPRVDIPTASGTLHAVRGIDAAVERGKTLCIVGESGCGKSLTALALMSLLPSRAKRTAKRMTFGDIDLAAISDREMTNLRGNRMAMVFQEPMTSLNPAYTIGNQLEERCCAIARCRCRRHASAPSICLETVGITAAGERLRQYPHQLSGGLRQRVMIAMALMCGPDLLICDEPTTALDVTIQAQILHLLISLQREFHMGMVLITHDLGIVARIADRVAVMYAGPGRRDRHGARSVRPAAAPYTQGLLRSHPRSRPSAAHASAPFPASCRRRLARFNDCAFPQPLSACLRRLRAPSHRSAHARRRPRLSLPAAVGASAANAEKIPRMSAPLLELHGVTRRFSVSAGLFRPRRALKAVNGVTLTINRGEVLGLVGESGCGKTTLARIALGLLDPSEGEVRLDGKKLDASMRVETARHPADLPGPLRLAQPAQDHRRDRIAAACACIASAIRASGPNARRRCSISSACRSG